MADAEAEPALQTNADEVMHLADLVKGWDEPGADGPDWLIGDNEVETCGPIGDRGGELAVDDIEGIQALALIKAFPEADYSCQACLLRYACFFPHDFRAFFMIFTPLGMAKDDRACACVGNHVGGNIACMRPRGRVVAVLGTDEERMPRGAQCGFCKQRGGQAEHQINSGVGVEGREGVQFGQIPAQAVHLPIPSHQFPTHPRLLFLSIARQLRAFPSGYNGDMTQGKPFGEFEMIPKINLDALEAGDATQRAALLDGLTGVGFLTLENTGIARAEVMEVIAAYRAFFRLPERQKQAVDMARTGSNRGWGAPGTEQVDPDANPDYKQVFDIGYPFPDGHPLLALSVYGANQWPQAMTEFRSIVEAYYFRACAVAQRLLRQIAAVIGEDAAYFDDKFDQPMALLRANFYPPRPTWAGEKDWGIATHTDYGCVTLLATDGVSGLEVRQRGGGWLAVEVAPGSFVINFGEMLEMWTEGRVKATPHRVRGSEAERISVPLFYNPRHDANVAPPASGQVIEAGAHLKKRFEETYLHLKKAM